MTTTRRDCEALDAADPLAALRDAFELPDDVVYLDGNSLGALPRATAGRMQQVVRGEWGEGLIRSWNRAGWIDLAQGVGDRIAALVGAAPGSLVAADSTSVNLFKVLHAAVAVAPPGRRCIVSERSNFPTDLYIAESIARMHGLTLRLADADAIEGALDENTAVLMLTHVNYRSGRLHDMAAITGAAHAAGALAVWDLAHSAGAMQVDLTGAGADFAVGCGYKYLNGGPGAPAFVWVRPEHLERMNRDGLRQPLAGWLGHAEPFAFSPEYRAAAGIRQFSCGTPPVLSMAALACGLEVFARAEPLGGMAALRAKSLALSSLFIAAVESRCGGHGLALATPRDTARRGSQASFAHPHAYAVMQALIERGVIGDFRAGTPGGTGADGDLLRFGFTPLYTRFVDVWDAADRLHAVLASGAWRDDRFRSRAAVT
jgi:kynureninase